MAQPIRVLILTHNYPRRAGDFSGIFLHLLARSLSEHDISPIVLAPHDASVPEKEIRDGVDIRRFRYETDETRETLAYRGNMHSQVFSGLAGILRFRRFLNQFEQAALTIIKQERIDVIAGHWVIPAGLVMRALVGKCGLPMILSSHGTDLRLLKKFRLGMAPYLEKLFGRLESWTVVSSYLQSTAATLFPKVASKIELLPLPHDVELFRRDSLIAKDNNLVVSVTRFTEQKRILQLIQAFAQVRKNRANAKLEIYGSGELENEARQLIMALNQESAISLHQPVPQAELPAIYNRAAVVVLNSFEEGFGLALSEAMLCGTAVIGTQSGGIVDIIDHEKTGLLVEVDNDRELANGIDLILTDDDLRIRLAEAGRQSALNRFSADSLASRYASLIRAAKNK